MASKSPFIQYKKRSHKRKISLQECRKDGSPSHYYMGTSLYSQLQDQQMEMKRKKSLRKLGQSIEQIKMNLNDLTISNLHQLQIAKAISLRVEPQFHNQIIKQSSTIEKGQQIKNSKIQKQQQQQFLTIHKRPRNRTKGNQNLSLTLKSDNPQRRKNTQRSLQYQDNQFYVKNNKKISMSSHTYSQRKKKNPLQFSDLAIIKRLQSPSKKRNPQNQKQTEQKKHNKAIKNQHKILINANFCHQLQFQQLSNSEVSDVGILTNKYANQSTNQDIDAKWKFLLKKKAINQYNGKQASLFNCLASEAINLPIRSPVTSKNNHFPIQKNRNKYNFFFWPKNMSQISKRSYRWKTQVVQEQQDQFQVIHKLKKKQSKSVAQGSHQNKMKKNRPETCKERNAKYIANNFSQQQEKNNFKRGESSKSRPSTKVGKFINLDGFIDHRQIYPLKNCELMQWKKISKKGNSQTIWNQKNIINRKNSPPKVQKQDHLQNIIPWDNLQNQQIQIFQSL